MFLKLALVPTWVFKKFINSVCPWLVIIWLGLALLHAKRLPVLRFAVPGCSLQSFCAGLQKGFPLPSLSRKLSYNMIFTLYFTMSKNNFRLFIFISFPAICLLAIDFIRNEMEREVECDVSIKTDQTRHKKNATLLVWRF